MCDEIYRHTVFTKVVLQSTLPHITVGKAIIYLAHPNNESGKDTKLGGIAKSSQERNTSKRLQEIRSTVKE